ncbi:hypothetical protein [Epilithonimonas xixisoli]|uniref:Phage head morphogenesis domain-containing protein n=1 Tax=Epilithonimonas xixisoli TaxID=1476462 RepID=A0A4V3H2G6_9FLAO|nr:hypothetical protein [Epilithonimonas xixisoli]TDX83966.1 hypothetical protein B0I22_1554 [Epilithonimonas xixisoli]
MRRLSPEEIARQKRLETLEKELKKILLQSFSLSINLPQIQNAIKNLNGQFSITQNKLLVRKINTILRNQFSKFNLTLINGIQKEFTIASDDLWNNLGKRYSKSIAQAKAFDFIRNQATGTVRDIASQSKTFIDTQKGGLKLSDRVWKAFENIPKEIDVMVQNHIKEGKSPQMLARELQKNLTEPNRIFRRVTNPKTGKLEWSKAAKNYHPGQGVYRSSYKNGLRLARTEINGAYRLAEWNGYQNNPLISGFEIMLSNNTENQCETCKRLAGIYPKWFKWSSWHPHCRCRMIPILITMAERQQLAILTLQRKKSEFKPKFIKDLPPQFISYLQDNKERISNASSLPYWFEDNVEELQKILTL